MCAHWCLDSVDHSRSEKRTRTCVFQFFASNWWCPAEPFINLESATRQTNWVHTSGQGCVQNIATLVARPKNVPTRMCSQYLISGNITVNVVALHSALPLLGSTLLFFLDKGVLFYWKREVTIELRAFIKPK